MRYTVVFDIDGTLSDVSHRLHHLDEPRDWDSFKRACVDDPVIVQTCHLLRLLYFDGANIILLTGRDESCRQDTERWMQKYMIPYTDLIMRKNDDYRHDCDVKRDEMEKIIEMYGVPSMVFEDRPSVVQLWKDMGLYVLNVYQGTKDF